MGNQSSSAATPATRVPKDNICVQVGRTLTCCQEESEEQQVQSNTSSMLKSQEDGAGIESKIGKLPAAAAAPVDEKWSLEAWLNSRSLPPALAPHLRQSLLRSNDNDPATLVDIFQDSPQQEDTVLIHHGNNDDTDLNIMTEFVASSMKSGNGMKRDDIDEILFDILIERKDEIFDLVLEELSKGMKEFMVVETNTTPSTKITTQQSVKEQEIMDSIPGKFDSIPKVLFYDGLNTFFGGLEGIIGSPSSDVQKAIMEEHMSRHNAYKNFNAPNYNVTTTSHYEWKKVDPKNVKAMKAYYVQMIEINQQLLKGDHPQLTEIEVSVLRCYTGPMYTIYNSIIRNIRGGSLNDLKALVKLVGNSEAVKLVKDAEAEQQKQLLVESKMNNDDTNTSPMSKNNDVDIKYRQSILQNCNLYTTTLHAINSGIIKLSKLTKACKVYRGISGRSLPESFLKPNEFDVSQRWS